MSIEQPTRRRRPLTLYDLYMAAKFHLLAAATHMCLLLIMELPACQHTFARLGWRLGPWSDLPFPYGDDPALPCPHALGEVLRVLIPCVFFCAVLLTLSHLLLTLLLTQAHTRFGWPRYWREVRSRVELWPAWVASARQCWWVWPAGLFIWHLLEGLSSAMSQAGYGVVDTTTPYFIAHLAVIAGAVAILTNRQIRAAVIRAVGPDDVRCFGCGYLLRGLRSSRCPECGLDHDSRAVRYGFVWQRSARWIRTRRTVLILLAVALLLAPVWCPSALLALPGEWLVWIPEMFHPRYGLLYRNPNVFPLRTDRAYIIRQGDAIVVLRFDSQEPAAGQITMEYWRTAEKLASKQPPDASFTTDLYNQSLTLPIGPYEFHCDPPQARMLWFHRPDDSFSIEVYEPDRLPEEFRGIEHESPNAGAAQNLGSVQQDGTLRRAAPVRKRFFLVETTAPSRSRLCTVAALHGRDDVRSRRCTVAAPLDVLARVGGDDSYVPSAHHGTTGLPARVRPAELAPGALERPAGGV